MGADRRPSAMCGLRGVGKFETPLGVGLTARRGASRAARGIGVKLQPYVFGWYSLDEHLAADWSETDRLAASYEGGDRQRDRAKAGKVMKGRYHQGTRIRADVCQSGEAVVSPPFLVEIAASVCISMVSSRNRVEPSANTKLAPPEWPLPQAFIRLS